MKQDLLAGLGPRLRALDKGAYERTYRTGGRPGATSVHQLLATLLQSLKVPYQENVPVDGTLRADFFVNGTYVFVERRIGPEERKILASKKGTAVAVYRDSRRSDRLDHGIRVIGLGGDGNLQTIFLDDPSFSFDYAHILPKTEKCSVMHGHTSSVLVEIVGRPVDGMVVDFGVAKQIVRHAVGGLDHKLFIHEKYVTRMDESSVTLMFETVHGPFAIQAPKATTVLLAGEATVENLAREVLDRVAPKMPDNVTAVGVYVYEGLNKGSHLMAHLHSGGVERRRSKR